LEFLLPVADYHRGNIITQLNVYLFMEIYNVIPLVIDKLALFFVANNRSFTKQ